MCSPSLSLWTTSPGVGQTSDEKRAFTNRVPSDACEKVNNDHPQHTWWNHICADREEDFNFIYVDRSRTENPNESLKTKRIWTKQTVNPPIREEKLNKSRNNRKLRALAVVLRQVPPVIRSLTSWPSEDVWQTHA